MALSEIEKARFEKPVREYIAAKRPPPHIRPQLDLSYRFDNQSVEIFELRPAWRRPGKIMESKVAKATYVKVRKVWRIYWQRADLKWHSYEPNAEVDSIQAFLDVVEMDEYGCFFG